MIRNNKIYLRGEIYNLTNPIDLNKLRPLHKQDKKIKQEIKCPECYKPIGINLNKLYEDENSMFFKHLEPSPGCPHYNHPDYTIVSLTGKIKNKHKNKNIFAKNLQYLQKRGKNLFITVSTLLYRCLIKDFLKENLLDQFIKGIEELINTTIFWNKIIDDIGEMSRYIIISIAKSNNGIIYGDKGKYSLFFNNKLYRKKEKKLCIFKLDNKNTTDSKPHKCGFKKEFLICLEEHEPTNSDRFWSKIEDKYLKLINKNLKQVHNI